MSDDNLKGSTLFSVTYPCCLCRTLRRCIGISHSGTHKHDAEEENKEPLCSKIVDAICFRPDTVTNSRTIVLSPETFALPFENIYVRTRDGLNLMAYLILQDEGHEAIPTIILFHGNCGNIGDRLRCCKRMFAWMNFNILLVEYRGFGFSEGHPTEFGVYLDAQAAFDYVCDRPDLDSKQIVIFGRSLGGAVAIDLAARENYKYRIAVVVIENTFCSLLDLGRHILPKLCIPLVHLLPLSKKFTNYSKISSIVRPTLFISSQKDTNIPPNQMTELYMKCKAVKKIHRYEKGDHTNPWLLKGYTNMFSEFVLKSIEKYPVAEIAIR